MDLIGGYLIVMLVLFTGNIALLMGNIKINNLKLIATSILFSNSLIFVTIPISPLNIKCLCLLKYIHSGLF